MKNKAIDLHIILFEQLERLRDLDDDEMKSDKLVNEIRRAEAMSKMSAQIISNGRLVLDGIKFAAEAPEAIELPEMITVKAPKALLPEQKPGRKLLIRKE
jgi:hypothetical protein